MATPFPIRVLLHARWPTGAEDTALKHPPLSVQQVISLKHPPVSIQQVTTLKRPPVAMQKDTALTPKSTPESTPGPVGAPAQGLDVEDTPLPMSEERLEPGAYTWLWA